MALQAHAQQLQHNLAKMMRRFGRQCRGMSKVFVTLVRQTERPLLEMGHQVLPLAWAAQACLQGAPQLPADQRARLDIQLTAALEAHDRIEAQSRRLTQGKALAHYKIVNANDPTIAPICKGKSNCPAQFGRKPGIIAEPAAGFIFALHLPVGNPSDVRYVEPLVDKVERAIAWVRTRPPWPSTRWPVIWRSMTLPCVRRCTSAGFSPWASRKPSIPFPRRLRRRTSSTAWTRRTCTTSGLHPRCTSPTRVATADQWSKASLPVCCVVA
jgi:hypothetical protein